MTDFELPFSDRSLSHDLYAVKSHMDDIVTFKVRFHALAVSTASVFM